MRIEQNFSSFHFHIDTRLLGPNAISKNANNVVISDPSVFIFSAIVDIINLVLHIRSGYHAHFRFGRQWASKFFFRIRFSRQPFVRFPNFFQGREPPDGPYLSSRGDGVRGQIWGPGPQSKNLFFFYFTKNPLHRFSFKRVKRPMSRSSLTLKFKFSRKWGSKFLGAGHFFEFAPLGAPFPK